MFKNVSGQKLRVFAFDYTTGQPKTGDAANLTAYVDIDGGGLTVLTDTSATEISSINAPGYYEFDLTQGESNGDTLLFTGKSSTANIVVVAAPATVYTDPNNWPDFVISASGIGDVRLADAVTHGGTTALLRLGSTSSTPAFHVTNNTGSAVSFVSTGAHGLNLEGQLAGLRGTGVIEGGLLIEEGAQIINSDGIGLIVLGTLTGIQVSGTAGIGASFTGTTTAFHLSGVTAGLNVVASGGSGIAVASTGTGLNVVSTNGVGTLFSGTTYGFRATGSAGRGMSISGTTFGLEVLASAGNGIDVTGGIGNTWAGLRLHGDYGARLTGDIGLDILGNDIGVAIGGISIADVQFNNSNAPTVRDAIWTGGTRSLSSDGLDSVLIESGIAASAALVNDSGAQLTSINLRQSLAGCLSALGAVLSGAATTNVVIQPAAKPAANPRIDAVVDEDGNRTAINLRVPD